MRRTLPLLALLAGCARVSSGFTDPPKPDPQAQDAAPPQDGGQDAPGPVPTTTPTTQPTSTTPTPVKPPGNESGSRIKGKWITTGDGAKQWAGWHDNQEDVDCSFTTAADGRLRCVPASYATGEAYIDASCARPAVINTTTCDFTQRIVTVQRSQTSACGTTLSSKTYRIGTSVQDAFYIKNGTNCVRSLPAGTAGTSFVAPIIEELEASRFVEGVYNTD